MRANHLGRAEHRLGERLCELVSELRARTTATTDLCQAEDPEQLTLGKILGRFFRKGR